MPYSISCVIPVHNGELYLSAAIESVLDQSFAVKEIVVVDDGSTDNSASVATSFGAKVKYEYQSRQGPSAARNRGILLSTGDYIAFLDADDLFIKVKLAKQVARLRQTPGLEIVAGYTENFLSPDFASGSGGHEFFRRAPWPRQICTWLVDRKVFDRIGNFDEAMQLSQDIDWLMRAKVAGVSMETLPDVLCRRRIHAANSTRFSNEACRAAVLESLRKHVIAPRRLKRASTANEK